MGKACEGFAYKEIEVCLWTTKPAFITILASPQHGRRGRIGIQGWRAGRAAWVFRFWRATDWMEDRDERSNPYKDDSSIAGESRITVRSAPRWSG